MPVRLRLLGPLGVEDRGTVRPLRLDRPASLLVYLAVRGGWVSRDEAALLYRPDAPAAEGLRYLRKLVFRARRLPWSDGLELGDAGLRWLVDSDLQAFRRASEAGALDRAVAAYGGPFLGVSSLSGVPGFSAWQERQREDAERRWLAAATGWAQRLANDGRHADAAALFEKVSQHEPYDEDVLRALLRSLVASGRRAEALRAYDAFRRTLHEELGSEPVDTTRDLADGIRRAAPLDPSAAGRPAMPRVRLPTPVGRLVGRRPELERLDRMLAPGGPRLITLVGLGGTGKTRLALGAAAAAAPRFEDGVVHVSLAAIVSPDRLPVAIVEALGLAWSGSDAETVLAAGLRDRRLLLLLDEFEGVIEGAGAVARIVRGAPGVTVLVTSREALEVSGEWLFDVGGLDVPPAGASDGLDRSDAVRLFTECAARVDPQFVPDRANLLAIADLCRALEGLPLAIELCASWTRTLDCRTLSDELERSAELLTTTQRDVPDRHRNLWAIFDYTCSRLPAAASKALPRLAAFRGGFTFAAAERVAGAGLEVLSILMNRALIRRTGDGRFAMHALVRQYARRRGAGTGIADAHARYYAEEMLRLTPDLKGRDPVAAMNRIHADLANVEAAWEHAVRTADPDLLDASRDALDHYYHYRSRWTTAADMFGRAVDALVTKQHEPRARRVLGRLLVHQAQYERALGDAPSATARAQEALALLSDAGTRTDGAYARLELAGAAYRGAAFAEARAIFQAVLDEARALGDAYLEGAAHNGLANVGCEVGDDRSLAEDHYRASLRAHTRLGNLEGINGALINLGACRYDVGDWDEAERLWREAVGIAERLGYAQREAVLHDNLGSLAESRGDHASAFDRYARSLALRSEIGDRPGMANVLYNLGRAAHAQGRFDEARVRLQEALELQLQLHDRAAAGRTRGSLACTLAALGLPHEASEHSREALAAAHDTGSRSDMLSALLNEAERRDRRGEDGGAVRLAAYVARVAAGTDEAIRERADGMLACLASAPALGADGAATGTGPAELLPDVVAAELRVIA